MKLSLPLRSVLSLDGRQILSTVAISCYRSSHRAYHVCSTATTGDVTTATGRGRRLLPLRRDDLQLTTHYYAVALHAVRRYSATGAVGASDGGRHDDPITVAADHDRVTIPPPPTTVPPTDRAAVDVTEEKSTSIIQNGKAATTYYYYLLHVLLLLLLYHYYYYHYFYY